MTLDGTRTFIVGARRPVVIDPGPDDAAHLEAVEKLLGGDTPAAILLTHAHRDHAGNALALAERTGAPLWMGRGARRLPFPQSAVGRWLTDGDQIDTDAGWVTVYETPGHAREHLAFYWESGKGGGELFAGDLFLGGGDTTLVSAPEGNLSDYLRSLALVRGLAPALIHPAHGPALRRPAEVIGRYLQHRLARVEQVRAAREKQPDASPEALVATVYGADLDPRLRGAAAGSIRAVLEYLAAGDSRERTAREEET